MPNITSFGAVATPGVRSPDAFQMATWSLPATNVVCLERRGDWRRFSNLVLKRVAGLI